MSNKKQRNREQGEAKRSLFDSRTFTVLGAVLFMSLFVALGIVIVTLLGGEELSKDDPTFPPIPALGAVPDAPRSAAADLLEGKSFDDMTDEDIALVAAEVERVIANSDLRFTSPSVAGLDISKRDGHTRAARLFRYRDDTPGGEIIIETVTTFFCDALPGTVDVYRHVTNGFSEESTYTRRSADSPSFERIVKGLDWSEPKDLGFRDIEGRRAHGVQIIYKPQDTSDGVEAEHWYDVENARLLAYGQTAEGPGSEYIVHWAAPPPITVPEDLSTPPCASLVTGE